MSRTLHGSSVFKGAVGGPRGPERLSISRSIWLSQDSLVDLVVDRLVNEFLLGQQRRHLCDRVEASQQMAPLVF